MAKRVEKDEEDEERDSTPDGEEDERASSEETDEDEEQDEKAENEEEDDEDEQDDKAAASSDEKDEAEKAEASTGEEEEDALPTQLGTQKYVFAAFFTSALIFAYIVGRLLETTWSWIVAREFFRRAAIKSSTLGWFLAADEDKKGTVTVVAGGFIALIAVIITYRKQSVRNWAEEVSTELTKVKWPTRKEVQGSTMVVLATSAVATIYLFLLDRFWGFVTNLIYGTGT